MEVGRIAVFLAAAAVAGAMAGDARGALFFLFEPTAAKPGDVVTVRTGGTPGSFTNAPGLPLRLVAWGKKRVRLGQRQSTERGRSWSARLQVQVGRRLRLCDAAWFDPSCAQSLGCREGAHRSPYRGEKAKGINAVQRS
jgi:hypothetical protein